MMFRTQYRTNPSSSARRRQVEGVTQGVRAACALRDRRFIEDADFPLSILHHMIEDAGRCALPDWANRARFIACQNLFGWSYFGQGNRDGADFSGRVVGDENFELDCVGRDLQLIAVKKAVLCRGVIGLLAKI
jgi:hypothetical protein